MLFRVCLQGLQNLKISRPVLVVHGCKGSDGQMVAIDFSELQVRHFVLHGSAERYAVGHA